MYLVFQTHILYLNTDSGALLKYFGAPSGTGQDEEPSPSATQASSEIISEPGMASEIFLNLRRTLSAYK